MTTRLEDPPKKETPHPAKSGVFFNSSLDPPSTVRMGQGLEISAFSGTEERTGILEELCSSYLGHDWVVGISLTASKCPNW